MAPTFLCIKVVHENIDSNIVRLELFIINCYYFYFSAFYLFSLSSRFVNLHDNLVKEDKLNQESRNIILLI